MDPSRPSPGSRSRRSSRYDRRISSTFSDLPSDGPNVHAAEIYTEPRDLVDSVAAFLGAGIGSGAPGLVLATPEHVTLFREALHASGWDARSLEDSGVLVVADAETTLDSIMEGGRPPPEAFRAVLGGLLDRAEAAAPGGVPRIFGEMVDLLSKRGQPSSAIALEVLWNSLAVERRFALLCGYELDVFDREAQTGPLPNVCRLHSHVRPASNYARFARAVDSALDEVLGRAEAGKIYVLLSAEIRAARVPLAQLILMWVSENMPALSSSILSRAKMYYAAGRAATA